MTRIFRLRHSIQRFFMNAAVARSTPKKPGRGAGRAPGQVFGELTQIIGEPGVSSQWVFNILHEACKC